jgi:hypothetical protein
LDRDLEVEPIFCGFIKAERDNILKEYRTAAGQDVTIPLAEPNRSTNAYPMKTITTEKGRTVSDFAGRDQRDLIREAIRFWEDYLDGVDKDVAELAAKQRG